MFYSIIFRIKLFNSIEEIQKELDLWLDWYNNERTHNFFGKTPMKTFLDTIHLAEEKQIDHLPWREGEAFRVTNPS